MAEFFGIIIIDVYLCEEMNDFEFVYFLDLVGRFYYLYSFFICFYYLKQQFYFWYNYLFCVNQGVWFIYIFLLLFYD